MTCFVSQSLRKFNASHFPRTNSCLCIYHKVVWWKFSLLHNSQSITFPTQSCLVCKFAAFTYVINCLISVSTFTVLLHIIRFFFLYLPSPGLLVGNLINMSLEVFIQLFFFPFLFSSFFVFQYLLMLPLLLQAAVISLSLLFLAYSLSTQTIASVLFLMLISPLLSLLDTQNMSMSSLGCKALSILLLLFTDLLILVSSSWLLLSLQTITSVLSLMLTSPLEDVYVISLV